MATTLITTIPAGSSHISLCMSERSRLDDSLRARSKGHVPKLNIKQPAFLSPSVKRGKKGKQAGKKVVVAELEPRQLEP